jgi:hypothetical protein
LAHLAATDDCDCIENISGIESITGDLVSLYDDPQVGQTTGLLGLHIGGSLHPGECPHHLFAFFAERFEIIAIEADADIGTDTGHQLSHTQLDRLAEAVGVAGNLILEGLFHGGDEFAFVGKLPSFLGFEGDDDVGEVDRHGVVGDLGSAGLADHRIDFGELLEALFNASGHLDAGFE